MRAGDAGTTATKRGAGALIGRFGSLLRRQAIVPNFPGDEAAARERDETRRMYHIRAPTVTAHEVLALRVDGYALSIRCELQFDAATRSALLLEARGTRRHPRRALNRRLPKRFDGVLLSLEKAVIFISPDPKRRAATSFTFNSDTRRRGDAFHRCTIGSLISPTLIIAIINPWNPHRRPQQRLALRLV